MGTGLYITREPPPPAEAAASPFTRVTSKLSDCSSRRKANAADEELPALGTRADENFNLARFKHRLEVEPEKTQLDGRQTQDHCPALAGGEVDLAKAFELE